jgi:hypothetical protein
MLVDRGGVDEGKGASSERLSIVIPERSPLAMGVENYEIMLKSRQNVYSDWMIVLAGWGTRWNAKRSLRTRVDRSASHNCPLTGPANPVIDSICCEYSRKNLAVY